MSANPVPGGGGRERRTSAGAPRKGRTHTLNAQQHTTENAAPGWLQTGYGCAQQYQYNKNRADAEAGWPLRWRNAALRAGRTCGMARRYGPQPQRPQAQRHGAICVVHYGGPVEVRRDATAESQLLVCFGWLLAALFFFSLIMPARFLTVGIALVAAVCRGEDIAVAHRLAQHIAAAV